MTIRTNKFSINSLYESHYALKNVKNNLKTKSTEGQGDKYLKVGLIKYYSDDTILRLVAAAEHLANSIQCMLEITNTDLKEFKEKRSNHAIVVGKYLSAKLPDNPITSRLSKMKENSYWSKAIEYRDKWIHNQPPLLEGSGIVFKRKTRWLTSSENYHKSGKLKLIFGGGDKPDYLIDDLVDLCVNSYKLFFDLYADVVDYYHDLLKNNHIKLNENVLRN